MSNQRVLLLVTFLAIFGGLSLIGCGGFESGRSSSSESNVRVPRPSQTSRHWEIPVSWEIPGPMDVSKISINDLGTFGMQIYVVMEPNDDTEYGVWYPMELTYNNHVIAEQRMRWSTNQSKGTVMFSVGNSSPIVAVIRGGKAVKDLFSIDYG